MLPTRLELDIKNDKVFLEIRLVLERAISDYNNWSVAVYIKIDNALSKDGPYDNRQATRSSYYFYNTREDLLEAILANCPHGYEILKYE